VATLSGLGRFGSSQGDVPAAPGTVALVAPRTPHDYGTARDAPGWEILWVHFQPPHEWLQLLHWPSAAPGIGVLAVEGERWTSIVREFKETLERSLAAGRRRREFAMNSLERLLLTCEDALPRAGHVMDGRVKVAVEYVLANLRQPLTVEGLSSLVHLSPSRFAHLFRAETGMPPLQYVGLQRMRRAKMLLERTTHSVGEVAAEVGMEPFHFSARFKAETSVSPREYRRAFYAEAECTAVHR
jgi:AraC family transcriptional regulator of arabinose operon